MNHVTHAEILDAIQDRTSWEAKQATWYKMRHDGLRRVNKPFPGASDMHFPLGDMQIEKHKPFYVSQLYAGDTIAAFTADKPEGVAKQNEVALWFDWQLKQRSNFEDEINIAIDKMLNGGVVPVKVYWDANRARLAFEAINPIYLIVPAQTGRLQDADWIVHVQHYSKHAYKRVAEYEQGEETLTAICTGESGSASGQSQHFEQAKATREGLTKPAQKNQIVVWEIYTRQADNTWLIRTYSPAQPKLLLRQDFTMPYNQGVFADKVPPPPFFELTTERKDRGFYDPRSIMERIAPFEASLCKDWNTKNDYQTLTCSPLFSAKNGVNNTQNLRFVPGQIVPFEITAVTMPPAPVDIERSMMGTRGVAEQLLATPDFGMGSQSQRGGKDAKTATEASIVANVMGQTQDMRTRNFRRELAHGLRLAWGIALQYSKAAREYRSLDKFQMLDEAAFASSYTVELNGSGDNWNRQMVTQKAQARFQLFKGDPFIHQENLRRDLLNSDDPRLTKTLLVNAGAQQAQQIEDQAQELSIMLLGYPAEVRETDDDVAHVQSIAGFVQRRVQRNEPLTAEFLALAAQHVATHLAKLQQTQPDRWKQVAGQLQPFAQRLQSAAQQAAQAEQAAAVPPLVQ